MQDKKTYNDISQLFDAGERLKKVREWIGISQADMAQALGVSQSTVSAWEKNTNPIPKMALTVLNARGVSLDWLIDGKGHMIWRNSIELVRAYFQADLADIETALADAAVRPMKRAGLAETASTHEVKRFREFAFIPVLEVRAGASSSGVEVVSEDEITRLAFRRDWLSAKYPDIGQPEDQLAVITAEGDSMKPTILDGDVLLVDTRQKGVTRDGVYVIRQGSLLSVKRLQRTPGGGFQIISDNSRYQPVLVRPEETGEGNEIQVCGRVLWRGGDLD